MFHIIQTNVRVIMLTNNQVFYYDHNSKTCLLWLVIFGYNHVSNCFLKSIMPFPSCFSHCSQIKTSCKKHKNATSSCCETRTCYSSHKSQGIFNLFKAYYYNFKNNNLSIQKNPLVIVLIIFTKTLTSYDTSIAFAIT
jgi:hypothetical protein